MKTLIVVLFGLIGGYVFGIVLAEIVGIVSFLLFDRPVGVKFLPILFAVLCAVVGSVSVRRKAGSAK
ncbi:hypothetical protein FE783_06570 [Paenibacillus mesophilus]|uniref:DUF5957 family protein n=1 Tax=Paenibacillus mesophilus TaxID=2582849 RepID=UPI00110EF37B|nr:DUF5957 family protein [Paenibacillus mesophilus]TMV51437.1 hypothetical protein FE783_06570 [Paenibacillus mesophilus]